MANYRIELSFKSKPSGLVGGPNGQKVYEEQIVPIVPSRQLVDGDTATIIFPKYVERVAASFVQGLTEEWAKKKSRAELVKMIQIMASSDRLSQKISSDIDFR